MASLVAGSARVSICGAVDHGTATGSAIQPTRVPIRKREVACELATSSRREMIVAGAAAFVGLGAGSGAAHAVKSQVVETAEEAASNPLIQKLLETSKANKAVNDAARLEDYYKRNFKEYFEFVEGSVRNKKELTPAEKAIVEWLAKNK